MLLCAAAVVISMQCFPYNSSEYDELLKVGDHILLLRPSMDFFYISRLNVCVYRISAHAIRVVNKLGCCGISSLSDNKMLVESKDSSLQLKPLVDQEVKPSQKPKEVWLCSYFSPDGCGSA
jgi:hypothetical protein